MGLNFGRLPKHKCKVITDLDKSLVMDTCRLLHVAEECENPSCDIRSCDLRHPRTCNYFRDYKRCKFSD